jgi:hypothetical protein
MMNQMIKKVALGLAIACVPALAFTACKSASEHPGNTTNAAACPQPSEHPTNAPAHTEHPTSEHPK